MSTGTTGGGLSKVECACSRTGNGVDEACSSTIARMAARCTTGTTRTTGSISINGDRRPGCGAARDCVGGGDNTAITRLATVGATAGAAGSGFGQGCGARTTATDGVDQGAIGTRATIGAGIAIATGTTG